MRKVIVAEYDKEKKLFIDKTEGNFIQYGVDYDEFENGAGCYSTGIIEFSDGVVRGIPLHLFRFI